MARGTGFGGVLLSSDLRSENPLQDQGVDAINEAIGRLGNALTALSAGSTIAHAAIAVPIDLKNDIAATMQTFSLGFAGTITKVTFTVTVPATTAAKAATLALKVGSTAVTGGAVALTSANCTPTGAIVAGSSVTGTNTFLATDTLTIVATSITAFAEGQGILAITF